MCALLFGFVLPVAVAVSGGSPAVAADPPAMKIGLPESMFSGVPQALVQPAARPFQTMLEKQAGLTGEVVVARDHADLAKQLKDGKLDIAVFHGFEYAWVKQNPELIPLVVTNPSVKLQACLVVNTTSKAKGPHELKGEAVAVPGGTKAHCRLYFDQLKTNLPEGCCGVAKLKTTSIEEAIDAVADDTCPAVLVDLATLTTYKKLKPGAGACLKVLDESMAFPAGVVVYRKDGFKPADVQKVRDGLVKCVGTPEGQRLTSLWRLKGFEEPNAAYQAELDKCLKAYPAPKEK
ncbi:MAG: phosphate/phosphite/phosphonate ABC transporter substrate-binding protein [Gemmataceae bacterium]|nr:phosphate/phosphite/phosphonate ABC transporter substrate-binding protein [Gemmataceae bacterium]